MPSVAVVIPCFNGAMYLEDAIRSALSQTFPPDCVIVVDDGSTDTSAKIAMKYTPRVRLLRQANMGVSVARNNGILSSNTDFVAFLDADDLWHPQKLEFQVDALSASPRSPFVFNRRVEFRFKREVSFSHKVCDFREANSIFSEILFRNPVHCSSVLVRRSAFARSGLFDPLLHGGEDTELWLRLAVHGDVLESDSELSYLRMHDNNTTLSFFFRKSRLDALLAIRCKWADRIADTTEIDKNIAGNAMGLGYEAYSLGEFSSAERYFSVASHHGRSRVLCRFKRLQSKAAQFF